ncbi:hypothetical protein FNV43_RR07367 [Rhamnella rubrinervis]|uniref:Uncharacterized protein n=1 Tax=Rhamnella rubrinervis TaxID=2594499 RepID=A0A8K0HEU0_9ROSA|nr:hypothetical protein FNV43_RR07367 [Rhamnella rubrinervis]
MGPLKRLRKANDKSTKATTTTIATATKKMSREVEESSNALQVPSTCMKEENPRPKGRGCSPSYMWKEPS